MIPFARIVKYGNKVEHFESKANSSVIQAQYSNVCVLKDGSLYGYGYNNYGQLGTGSTTAVNSFVKIKDGVLKYWLGVYGTLVLSTDGKFFYSGMSAAFPQLSLLPGNPTSVNIFTDVTQFFTAANLNVSMIADCYIGESMRILSTNGEIFVCGRNSYGECGVGTTTQVPVLSRVSINKVDSLRCSFDCTFVNIGGVIHGCGKNEYGQLGVNNINVITSFTTNGMNNVKDVFASQTTTWFFKGDGKIWWCGANNGAQAGNNTMSANKQMIPIQNSQSTAVWDAANAIKVQSSLTNTTTGGALFGASAQWRTCGNNYYGQIGNGSSATTPVQALFSIPLGLFTSYDNINTACKDWCRAFIMTNDYKLYACGGDSGSDSYRLPDGSINQRVYKLMASMPWY